jgi:hypothetical protein
MKTWVLVANASEASLYSTDNLRGKDFTLIKSFSHPESREREQDLVSDRPGKFHGSHNARSGNEQINPKTVEAGNFALELANFIKHAHNTNAFEQLIFVSSSHFQGLIHKHFDYHQIQNLVIIPKDYTKLLKVDLLKQVQDHIYK